MLKSVVREFCPEFVMATYRSFRLFLQRKYRILKYRKLIKQTQEHYKTIAERIKNRGNKSIRFASYVVYDSTFGAYELMELMIARQNNYSPKIVICPDVARGEHHLREQYKKTKEFFVNKYGKEYVIDGYDEATGSFIDVSDQFDIIYCANPYDAMVNKVHGVQYLSTRNVLPVYITYCFQPNKYTFGVMSLLEVSLFWKVFTDTQYTMSEYQRYELIKGKNVELTGYAKMDSLGKYASRERSKKRIIISPHHTITNTALPLSNFLKYKDFILTLPQKFPQVNFVFRPHPLLFINMINEGFWTEKDRDAYIISLRRVGIEYSAGGDYFDLFVNSDALIHDCSSYMVEYLYLDKPCCFVKKDNTETFLSKLGNECLKCHDVATNEQEIESFIQRVVSNSYDIHGKNRDLILKKVKINYPKVSQKIMECITV